MENNDDNTIQYRSTSRYESEAKEPNGRSFVRVTSYETRRSMNTSTGGGDYMKKHMTITDPDNVSGEVLVSEENDRTQHLRKLKSSFFSNLNGMENPQPDPFARYNTRSLPSSSVFQDKSFIEIHKFPFAEPFSSLDSIKKEQISYTTTTQLQSGKKVTNVTKTEIKGDTRSCSIIETNETTVFDDSNSKPVIEEIKD